jgi:hypothetical protein
MTTITLYLNKHHEYEGFDVYGHAEYARYGEDILCSAISMLVINTINSIERFTDDKTSCVSNEDDGSIIYRFTGDTSHDAQLLVKSMILGLESLKDNDEYRTHMDVIIKEV